MARRLRQLGTGMEPGLSVPPKAVLLPLLDRLARDYSHDPPRLCLLLELPKPELQGGVWKNNRALAPQPLLSWQLAEVIALPW